MPDLHRADAQKQAWDLIIRQARLLDQEGIVDIGVRDGRITTLRAGLSGPAAKEVCAMGGLVTPSFVDTHFHLDKTLSRGIYGATNPRDAFAKARDVKKQFSVADVEARACRALDLAVAHGIGRMRVQVDVDFATRLVSMEGVLRARERFQGLVDVEIVAFPQEGIVADPEAPALLREALSMGANVIGGLPECEESIGDQLTHLRTIFDIAEQENVSIDLHCDYLDEPELKTLEMTADATIERGFHGRVVAGHCNALSVYSDEEAKRVIDKVRQANIQITVLPVGNLQMLVGSGRTPCNRGSSRTKELLDAGVNVAAGADNMFDIWYRFNRLDPIEVGYIACLSAGMKSDQEVREAFNLITTRGARLVGAYHEGISVGAPADLVVHSAPNLVEVFRNCPGRRIHVKRGRLVGGLEGSMWSGR